MDNFLDKTGLSRFFLNLFSKFIPSITYEEYINNYEKYKNRVVDVIDVMPGGDQGETPIYIPDNMTEEWQEVPFTIPSRLTMNAGNLVKKDSKWVIANINISNAYVGKSGWLQIVNWDIPEITQTMYGIIMRDKDKKAVMIRATSSGLEATGEGDAREGLLIYGTVNIAIL